jgi:hypothetical protein
LYEFDLSGQKNTRKIAENLCGFNGFDFGPDGYLYLKILDLKMVGV